MDLEGSVIIRFWREIAAEKPVLYRSNILVFLRRLFALNLEVSFVHPIAWDVTTPMQNKPLLNQL